MIKTGLYLLLVSSGAYGVSVGYPSLLDIYYSIMVVVGVFYAARTFSFPYGCIVLIMCGMYGVENNSQLWQVDVHLLSIMYFFSAFLVLIFKTDDGFKVSKIIAAIIGLKWLSTMMLSDDFYTRYMILNFLSIAQWVVFTVTASKRIELNKGYTKKDRPFMLRQIWNQYRTRSGVTKSV